MKGWNFVLCGILIVFCVPLSGQKERGFRDHINQVIRKSEELSRVAGHGMMIATIRKERIDYHLFDGSDPKIDSASVFELGDISQIFTSHLIYELHDQGKIDPETSIQNYLQLTDPNLSEISIQDCLSHISGLPRIPNNLGIKQISKDQPYANYSPEDVKNFLNSWDPGSIGSYQYSLLGYGIVQHALEAYLDMPFMEIMKKSSLSFYLDFEKDPIAGFGKTDLPADPLILSSHHAAVGLRANIKSLSKYIKDILVNPDKKALSMLQVQAKTGLDKDVQMASGWHRIQSSRKHYFHMHKGNSSGHASFIGINLEDQLGVVILAQTKTNLGPLGYYVMNGLRNGKRRSNKL